MLRTYTYNEKNKPPSTCTYKHIHLHMQHTQKLRNMIIEKKTKNKKQTNKTKQKT